MTRSWQPGDVAIVEGLLCIRMGNGMWEHGHSDRFSFPSDCTARPLAVIDPEDAEQAEGFYLGFLERMRGRGISTGHMDAQHNRDIFREALREFVDPTPPKPAEPSGLGAVVVDDEGDQLVRVHRGSKEERWICHTTGRRYAWGDLRVVTVLSDGVS